MTNIMPIRKMNQPMPKARKLFPANSTSPTDRSRSNNPVDRVGLRNFAGLPVSGEVVDDNDDSQSLECKPRNHTVTCWRFSE